MGLKLEDLGIFCNFVHAKIAWDIGYDRIKNFSCWERWKMELGNR